MMKSHNDVMEEIIKLKKNLRHIIELLAEKE